VGDWNTEQELGIVETLEQEQGKGNILVWGTGLRRLQSLMRKLDFFFTVAYSVSYVHKLSMRVVVSLSPVVKQITEEVCPALAILCVMTSPIMDTVDVEASFV